MLQREDLARHHPSKWAPGGCEKENVDAHKCDTSLLCGHIIHDDPASGVLAGTQGTSHGHDELTDSHAYGAPKEERTTAKLVHAVESWQSRDNVDSRSNDLDNEGIVESGVLKVLCAIVENEVDAGKLLQRLETHTRKLTLKHMAPEAVNIAGFAEAHFKLVVRANFTQLCLYGRVVCRQTSQPTKRLGGRLVFAALDKIPRRLGQDAHAADENDGPGKLHGDGDPVGPRVHAQRGGVVHNGGEEQADGDGKLVGADNGTTDPFGRGLGLVQRDEGGDETYTQSGEEAACEKEGKRDSGCLENDAEGEDETGQNEGEATANVVSHKRRGKGAKEGSCGQNGDDGGLLRWRDGKVTFGVAVAG